MLLFLGRAAYPGQSVEVGGEAHVNKGRVTIEVIRKDTYSIINPQNLSFLFLI